MSDQPVRPRIEPRPECATFFVTCLVDQFRPEVGHAVVDVLSSEGVKVNVPKEQTCCGQPAFNSGFRTEARSVASRFLDLFDQQDGGDTPIVAPSGSCAAMVRNYYPVLFRDDPAELERAKRVGDRLWEFSEFIVDGLGLTGSAVQEPGARQSFDAPSALEGFMEPVPAVGGSGQQGEDHSQEDVLVGTYHRCCHALRELGIDRQPVELIEKSDSLEMKPLERSEVCCGFGGAFSIKMPDISTAMLDEKLDNVEATGASTLIAGDTGCIMHMEGGLRRRGSDIKVLHIAQLLAESLKTRSGDASTTGGSDS